MGVSKLWPLLGDSMEHVPLSSCSGEKWAVDLTAWIVHGYSAGSSKSYVSERYVMMKTVFYRTLCLLKNGIIPIFVMDAQKAPNVKGPVLQHRSQSVFGHTKEEPTDRSGLAAINAMCQQLLEPIGLTVITSPSEAEKTCAYLNRQEVVNGCLTDDSDVFAYGAATVYRNVDFKEMTVERYSIDDIKKELELDRNGMVVLACLGGCDFGKGVTGVGPATVCELLKDMRKYEEDIVTRVLTWKENTELKALSEKKNQLKEMHKSPHCGDCKHTGKRPEHQSNGCGTCQTSKGCVDESTVPCDCLYHALKREIDPYDKELSVWKKALETEGFPNTELVKEFLEDDKMDYPVETVLKMPDWTPLAQQVKQYLNLDQDDLMAKMIPILVHMHLHGTLDVPGAKPLSILKSCKRNFVLCYQVPWERFEFDQWTPGALPPQEKTPDSKRGASQEVYTVDVECELFGKKYPTLVQQFTQSSSKRSKKTPWKRGATEDTSQGKLTDVFKAAKRKLFDEDKE
ncbi:hypothetical protein BaRGS_00012753 [Batillaria attramentaria]|uniref:Uncharacterized protein n=1 Tax=Batillaria attramentaria TaxID=370345 RepID=A0ABD0L971_9CAEN